MTREEAKRRIDSIDFYLQHHTDDYSERDHDAMMMAISALEQEPCELLIIKSDIFLHQDDRKKWMDSIKREKENGVIILPPYFEPLLVPANIEINMEQQPCEDAVSREAVIEWLKDKDIIKLKSQEERARQELNELPSVTVRQTGEWVGRQNIERSDLETAVNLRWKYECSECGYEVRSEYHFCPNCGACMKDGRTLDEFIEDSKESED